MEIVLAHRQLDFDALASMVGAQKLYPKSFLVLDGKSNPYVQDFLALSKDRLPIKKAQDIDLAQVTRVILVDTHDLARAGEIGMKLAKAQGLQVEVFDHHPYAGDRLPGMQIEPVGACATLLVEKIASAEIPLSQLEATLLALGIYDDTGSLLFENTTSRDVQAVAYLLENGANLGVVAEYLRRPLNEEQKELLQELLDNGMTENIEGMDVYLTYAQSAEYVGGIALLANRIGELAGAETWFLLVEMEGRLYLVGRSRGKGLPVNQIAQAFGGNGHQKAASATLKGEKIEQVLDKLRAEIRSRVDRPYTARDIMSFPVKTVLPEAKLGEVEQILLRYGHTGVPVVNDGRLVGIISRRDVEKAVKHGMQHLPVGGIMATRVITVGPDARWDEIQRLMVQHDIGRVPVVEGGQVIGIVSRSDVLRMVHGGAVPTESGLARERSIAMRQDILNLLDQLPGTIRSLLETIRDTAAEEGCSVYLVGGFVRDLLLYTPTQDLDLVIEGNGMRFAAALAKYLPDWELALHPQFGTARLACPDGTHLDVASTRWEYYAFPGALPQVEESCLKDDLFRRDFTMNAMAISLNEGRFGELVDYYGGLRDLQQGEVRFLHNLSFIDDPTRILRAIRFAGRYKFHLAKESLDALETALQAEVFKNLSVERFTHEWMLVLAEKNYLAMGQSLLDLGVLKDWFGENYRWNFTGNHLKHPVENHVETSETNVGVSSDASSEGNHEGNGREAPVENIVDSSDWPLVKRWVMTLRDMESGEIDRVLGRLKLVRPLRDSAREYAHLRAQLRASGKNLTEMDKLLWQTPSWLLDILAMDNHLQEALSRYQEASAKMEMNVDGNYLLKMGIKEGPEVGRILRLVREAWLSGRVNSTQDEEKMLKEILKEMLDKQN